MCFSFAAKMAADTNQLKELRESLHAGNEDSSMVLFVGSEKCQGEQVENKERHFEEVERENTQGPCLSHNGNHGLETFYTSLHLK